MKILVQLDEIGNTFWIDWPTRINVGDIIMQHTVQEEAKELDTEDYEIFMDGSVLYCDGISWGRDINGEIYQWVFLTRKEIDICPKK